MNVVEQPVMWRSRLRALCVLVLLVGCATSGDPIEVKRKPKRTTITVAGPAPPPADAGAPDHTAAAAPSDGPSPRGAAAAEVPATELFADVGFKEVTERDWLAGIRQKVAQQHKIDPTGLRLSPGLLRAVFVHSPTVAVPTKPGRRAPPRRHQIIVVDNQGRRVGAFRPITAAHGDEPPKDLRFLSEDRLVYEVVAPPPGAATPAPNKAVTRVATGGRKGARNGAKKSKREPPRAASEEQSPVRLFVIQPIAPGARPIRCRGIQFAFTRQHDRLAFVGGQPESAFVAVDGAQVYPRRGRTIVSSAPAWSKDGRSLAFLESPAAKPTRLVLLAEFDNPTGDTTWDLPAATSIDGTRVFWSGSGKLLVGKTAIRPVFSASFEKEAPPTN